MTDDIQPIAEIMPELAIEREPQVKPSFELDGRTFIYFKSYGWRLKMYTPQGIQWINVGTHEVADIKLAMQNPAIVSLIGEVMSDEINRHGLRQMINRTISWDDALKEWRIHLDRYEGLAERTSRYYYSHALAFIRRCGLLKKQVNAIECDHVIDQCNNITHALRATTRMYRLVIMRRFLDWAAVKGYSLGNVARLIKRVNVRDLPLAQKVPIYKKPFTDEQIKAVLDYYDRQMAKREKKISDLRTLQERTRQSHWYDPKSSGFIDERCRTRRDEWVYYMNWKSAFILALETGLRLYDCTHLEWDSVLPSDITSNGKYILVYTHKRDRRLMIPMPDAVRAMIPLWLEYKGDDRFVFPALMKIKRDNLSNTFAVATKAAKLPKGMSFHCARVTYAYRCRDKGLSMEHIRQLLTHLDAETTERYLGGPQNTVFPLQSQFRIYREMNEDNQNAG